MTGGQTALALALNAMAKVLARKVVVVTGRAYVQRGAMRCDLFALVPLLSLWAATAHGQNRRQRLVTKRLTALSCTRGAELHPKSAVQPRMRTGGRGRLRALEPISARSRSQIRFRLSAGGRMYFFLRKATSGFSALEHNPRGRGGCWRYVLRFFVPCMLLTACSRARPVHFRERRQSISSPVQGLECENE